MEQAWTRGQFVGYLNTWSAVDRRRTAEGGNPVDEVATRLEAWWPQDDVKLARWPLLRSWVGGHEARRDAMSCRAPYAPGSDLSS
jgi:hypothetical protein